MKKILLLTILLILCTSLVSASWLGGLYEWYRDVRYSSESSNAESQQYVPIEDSILDLQKENAKSSVQISDENQLFNYKQAILYEQLFKSWGMILALFYIVIDTVKLLFFITEILVVSVILFVLIPATFFKLRDNMINWYLRV